MPEPMRWFPFYPDRFLTSKRVRRMDAQRVGVYWLLLIEQWDNGAIGDDDEDLELVGRAEINIVRDVLAACFRKTRKGWVNEALEDVRREQHERAQKLSRAGQIAGYKSAQARAKRRKSATPERSLNDRPTIVDQSSTIVNQENRIEENRIEERESTTARAHEEATPQVNGGTQNGASVGPEVDAYQPNDEQRARAAELHVDLGACLRKWRANRKAHPPDPPPTDLAADFDGWLEREPGYANGNGARSDPAPMLHRLPVVPWVPPPPVPEEDRAEVARQAAATAASLKQQAAAAPAPRRRLSREEQLAAVQAKREEKP